MFSSGPDAFGSHSTIVSDPSDRISIELHASVLHLRGKGTVKQPVVGDSGDCLLWNGQVFHGLDVRF